MEPFETVVRDELYIGGKWVPSSGSGTIDVIDSTTEQVIGTVPDGSVDDVDRAVAAARAAFPSWSATPVADRTAVLTAVGEALAERTDLLADLITHEVGMPRLFSQLVQVGLPLNSFRTAAQVAEDFTWEQTVGNSLVVREPIGVVGCITPWNYPLHQVAAKVAPAIGAGCTVVLKPSEVAPLSAFILAEIIDRVRLPRGVFNMVTGDGPTVGEAIAGHPGVDMVSFTGSTRAGRRVSEIASQTVKRVTLELGGKSPNVILDDADLARAVRGGVQNCYLNSGQTCSAWTRMLVPRSKHDEAARLAKQVAEAFTLGGALDAGTKLGPLVSKRQQDRVRAYIRKGIEEGATLVTGGPEQPEGLPRGFFVRPTVFANVKTSMTIAQEEIFGPVLCILPYDNEEDAIRLANDTIYGLAAGVWSADVERAKRVARRIRAGQVDINGGNFNPMAPFGGYKQSGHGREFGKFGFEEFQETKSLQL